MRLDDALYDDAGRSKCAHDYLRKAIQDRYLPSQKNRRSAHYKSAQWWSAQEVDARMISELPWQWYTAQAWQELRACLTGARTGPSAILQIDELELWRFWLCVEYQCRVRVEEQLKKVFPKWVLRANQERVSDICVAVPTLLSQAGRYGLFNERLRLRTLLISKKYLGLPDVAIDLSNLAELYYEQGDYAKALPLLVRALALREKALGKDHPHVAIILNNLALLYKEQGKYAKALPMYVRALAISEKALGKDHPSVATSLNNLALLYCEQGDDKKGLPMYVRALAISEKALGKDHPDIAKRLKNLALL